MLEASFPVVWAMMPQPAKGMAYDLQHYLFL